MKKKTKRRKKFYSQIHGMLWKDVLQLWEKGYVLQYPKTINTQFYWRTTPVDDKLTSVFRMEFEPTDILTERQDCEPFEEYFPSKTNTTKKIPIVVSFPNITKTAYLIVPKPLSEHQNVSYLKDFLDNATQKQQHLLWKTVAKTIRKMLKTHKQLWISTHGNGVPCLHIRIDQTPKYYHSSKLKKIVFETKPQKSKLSQRAKWRKKMETKMHKQHKEARKRFGIPTCSSEEIIREGYYRKAYTMKNGKKQKARWIKPICVKDKGLHGKKYSFQNPGEGIGPLKKDLLKKYGYSTKRTKKERQTALTKATYEHPSLRIFRRLNAIRILTKNTNPKVSTILVNDMKWFRKKFDKDFVSSWKDSALFR